MPQSAVASRASQQASQPPRYFRNDASLTRRNPQKQLFASLIRLLNEHPPASVPPGGGLYHGPLSIAYLLLNLHPHYPSFTVDDRTLSSWSALYVQRAQECMADYPGPSPRRCGVAEDILCLLAMGAVSGRDAELAREVCGFAVDGSKESGSGKGMVLDDRAGDEWLFGRAGFLWLLRFMRGAFEVDDDDDNDDDNKEEDKEKKKKRDDDNDTYGDDDDDHEDRGHGREHRHGENAAVRALIDDTTDRVIEAIMASPRPWKWHGKAYLGAVHGMTGILTQILLSRPGMASELEPDVGALLSYQYDDDDYDRDSTGGGLGSRSGGSGGNWPSSIPPGKDRLVQFCHGAPGIVTSLVSLRRIYAAYAAAAASRSRHRHHQHSNGDNNGQVNTNKALLRRIDRAIARGRRCIISRGLLTKEPCLCHGISGNGLALAASVDAHEHEHDHDKDRDHGRDRHNADPESRNDNEQEDDDDEDYISFTQFEHFLTYTTGHEMKALARDGMMEPSDEPAGLYTGEAGRAWAWAVADGALGWGFPGYNDL